MGKATAFKPARLILGVLFSGDSPRDALLEACKNRFGEADSLGPLLPFRWSDYYDAEMGARPERDFISFSTLVDPASLAGIKTWTNELELSFSKGGPRTVNIDPGLLSLSRFVLATTKDRPHRIPLSNGIYAETTLLYERGDFRALPWTYPDWASEEYLVLLRSLRERLRRELRAIT
jgi:hypothetical protein